MKEQLFDSWQQWKICTLAALRKLWEGVWRLLKCLFFGFLSILRWLWRVTCDFVSNYPQLAIILSFGVMLSVWCVTYATMRAKVVSAEGQRDSIRYEYVQFKDTMRHD